MGIHILTKFHKGNLRGVGVGWSLRSRRSPGVRSLCAAWVLCGRFLPEENAGIWRVWQLSDLGTPHCHMELVGSWTCKRSDSLSLYISYLLSHLISLVFPGQYVVPSDKHYASGCKLQMLQLTLRYSSAGPRGSELSELTVLADSRCCVECVFCAERWARSAWTLQKTSSWFLAASWRNGTHHTRCP
jgi:hypothetical protein